MNIFAGIMGILLFGFFELVKIFAISAVITQIIILPIALIYWKVGNKWKFNQDIDINWGFKYGKYLFIIIFYIYWIL